MEEGTTNWAAHRGFVFCSLAGRSLFSLSSLHAHPLFALRFSICDFVLPLPPHFDSRYGLVPIVIFSLLTRLESRLQTAISRFVTPPLPTMAAPVVRHPGNRKIT